MKIFTNILFSVVLLSMTCSCVARPIDKESSMVLHDVRVDGLLFKFGVPVNESIDFPREQSFQAFDSGDSRESKGLIETILMRKFWDYRSKEIGLNNDGTMIFQFRVRQFDDGVAFNFSDVDSMLRRVKNQLDKSYVETMSERENKENHAVVVPSWIEVVKVDGRDSLHYVRAGDRDFDAYLVPVSSSTYVQIQFGYIDNSRGLGAQWRQKARQDADAIFQSIKINEIVAK